MSIARNSYKDKKLQEELLNEAISKLQVAEKLCISEGKYLATYNIAVCYRRLSDLREGLEQLSLGLLAKKFYETTFENIAKYEGENAKHKQQVWNAFAVCLRDIGINIEDRKIKDYYISEAITAFKKSLEVEPKYFLAMRFLQ